MSLEKAIADLTTATIAHTAALNLFLKAGGKATAGATTAGATTAAAADKPKATGTKPKAGPTLEDIQTRFGAYMSVTDKQVRAERKAHVLNISGKFGAERATLIDPEHFKEALDLLTQYENGEDPFAEEAGDEDETASPI